MGIFEVAAIDEPLRLAIQELNTREEIQRQLRTNGTAEFKTDALCKAATGLVSFSDAVGIRWLA